MSIASEISRLQSDSAAIKSAIQAKGVTVPSGSGFDDYASLIASIPTGGGSSRLVIGNFTANSTSGAQSITIPYTGNGYPIAALIYPKDGVSSTNSDWYDLVQRYVVGFWAMHKYQPSVTPTYGTSGNENSGDCVTFYKNSTSSATTYGRSGNVAANTYSSSNANANVTTCARFKSSTLLSVYIAASSYGFVPSLEYTYIVIYSA